MPIHAINMHPMPFVTTIPARLLRWLLFTTILVVFALSLAGRLDLTMLNAYLGVCAVVALGGTLAIDPDLVGERLRRGQGGEDPARLLAIRLLFLAHAVIGLLDVGRFHWSAPVPVPLQIGALAAFGLSLSWVMWAVSVNRFFVPVVRIQTERGHRVVSAGPYAIVRHPGYAGLMVTAPASALALGSWWALLPALALVVLFLRRAVHEDGFLMGKLPGYGSYAETVRWRLVPGVWVVA